VPAGLFVAASSGEIMEANPGMARILGYGSAEEITRRSINQLLPDGEAAERWRVGLASRETLEDIQTTLRRADGSNATVRMSARWVEGEVPGTRQLLGMVHEVQPTAAGGMATSVEDRRLKDDLEQMVYVVAHDLQQPLNVVGRFLDLIAQRDGERLSEAGREYLEHATSASSNLQRMVDAVLRYARVDTSDQQFEAVDLNRTFDKAVTLLEQEIQDGGAQITRDDLPAVMADEAQMVQLFHNLLGNAVKFRGERAPVVHVAAEERPQEWVLSLQDNGIGIDSGASERIFQMFQRLHTDVEYPGTGIGLAVCKRIVSHHGGRIWVESTPGEGATFFVALPKRNVPAMMEE
jgi:two-component system, chemotaxis family, sensor kinase Cph1